MTPDMTPDMTLTASRIGVRVDGRDLLTDVTVTCPPGRVTGLLGPNGSGKTTLLNVLGGLRRPSAGEVRMGRHDVHRMGARHRARTLAMVEQQATTSLDLVVRDVVALGRLPHRSRWAVADAAASGVIERALEIVDASDFAGRTWSGLSGGERQRVHLARALAQEPEVLLLDEPTNHLDLTHQLHFLDRIRGLGLTTVIALHDLDLAAAYCDDVVILDGGRVVRQGPTASALDADVVAEVYRVDVSVEAHPARPGHHIRWNRALEGSE